MATEIASFFAKIGADVGDFEKGLRGVKSDMSSLEKTSAALGTAFKAAFAIGVAGAVAFGAVIGKTVKAAADFEQGVADIGAMMSLTAEDTATLGDHIMDLGLDPKLKVSAGEATDAIMALGTAGLSVTEIMGGASEATVLLANATAADFGNAATIATDVMGQFNIKAGDMKSAVDQITGVTVASKFTINDYQLAIAQAGGVAGSVGMDFEDFNAIIAATSSSFASGSDSGTSLKTMLQRLVPDTEKAMAAMDELGLRTADGASKFFDASGAMKSAEEIAGLLQEAFGGLSDSQKIAAASTIFGTDAMRTALSLAEGGTPIIQKMKGEIGKVDAEELAAKRMDTFKGAMEIAWGVIETLSISIGQKFLPVLRPLVETFTQLAQTYGPGIVAFFGQVAEQMAAWITATKDAVTKGMGPFVERLKEFWAIGMQVKDLIAQFVDSFISTVAPVTKSIAQFLGFEDVLTAIGILLAGPVLAALGGLIAALWPVISTIAAVTAAVAALRWAWQNDFLGIQTFTRNTLQRMSDWFYNESGIWKGTWEKTLEYLKWWANGGWKLYILAPLSMRLQEMYGDVRHFTLGTVIRFQEWVQDVKDIVAGWKNDIVAKFTNVKDLIVEAFNDWMGPIKKDITDWLIVTDSKFGIWAGWIKRYFTDIKDWFVAKWQQILDWWDDHIKPWVDTGAAVVQGLWDGMEDVWDHFILWWNGVWGKDLTKTVKVEMKTKSPSKVMEKLGGYVMEGFGIGAEKWLPYVEDVMGQIPATSMAAGQGAYMPAGAGASQPAVSTSRIEELLLILINELRAKNMTANVTVAGGGSDIATINGFLAGSRI